MYPICTFLLFTKQTTSYYLLWTQLNKYNSAFRILACFVVDEKITSAEYFIVVHSLGHGPSLALFQAVQNIAQ